MPIARAHHLARRLAPSCCALLAAAASMVLALAAFPAAARIRSRPSTETPLPVGLFGLAMKIARVKEARLEAKSGGSDARESHRLGKLLLHQQMNPRRAWFPGDGSVLGMTVCAQCDCAGFAYQHGFG